MGEWMGGWVDGWKDGWMMFVGSLVSRTHPAFHCLQYDFSFARRKSLGMRLVVI